MSTIIQQISNTLYAPTDSQSTCILKTIGVGTVAYLGYRTVRSMIESDQRAKENEINLGKLAQVVGAQEDKITELEWQVAHQKHLITQAVKTSTKTLSTSNSLTTKTSANKDGVTILCQKASSQTVEHFSTSAMVDQVFNRSQAQHKFKSNPSRQEDLKKDNSQTFGSSFANGLGHGLGQSLGQNAGSAAANSTNLANAAWSYGSWGFNKFFST